MPLSTGGPVQLSDIDGDGKNELILRGEGINGFFEYRNDHFESFTSFDKNPVIDWEDKNMKMIDLSGDGHPDILITERNIFRWYPSDAKKGYDTSRTAPVPVDNFGGPVPVFSDPAESIYLADMSGDGLTDIVRIRNGEICYWPNMGHGFFGERVFMDNAPKFDKDEKFNQKYIKLGDIDGSGTTDIFYFGKAKPQCWFNNSGNSWDEGQTVENFLPVDSLTSVSLIDIEGTGTLCLVWSSQRPGMKQKQMSYIDLMGEKPHLLKEIDNNMGKIIRMSYGSSVKFYLEDKKAGKPWITRLGFPVQCLSKVQTIDEPGCTELVTEYRYHHGYFDGKEREFRGFGMVETIDTETYLTPPALGCSIC